MSRPRAATSVATRMFLLPERNLPRAPRRELWDNWPWSGMAPRPSERRRMARRWVSLTVRVKIMADWPENSLRRYTR